MKIASSLLASASQKSNKEITCFGILHLQKTNKVLNTVFDHLFDQNT